jgi:hypothetical protein
VPLQPSSTWQHYQAEPESSVLPTPLLGGLGALNAFIAYTILNDAITPSQSSHISGYAAVPVVVAALAGLFSKAAGDLTTFKSTAAKLVRLFSVNATVNRTSGAGWKTGIQNRLTIAKQEMAQANRFNHQQVNDQLDDTVQALATWMQQALQMLSHAHN